jgi:hypothetical protein
MCTIIDLKFFCNIKIYIQPIIATNPYRKNIFYAIENS